MSAITVENIVAYDYEEDGRLKEKVLYDKDSGIRDVRIQNGWDLSAEIRFSICGHKLERMTRLQIKSPKNSGFIERRDYEGVIKQTINEFQSGRIILTEGEMLSIVYDLIKEKYDAPFFKTQVCIANSIADGLAFVQDSSYRPAKILAFEVKTDKDNYSRLKSQVENYIHIADEVWLVVQNKKVPPDLPFFVGVIRCNGEPQIIREAIDVKHTTDITMLWKQMIKNVNREVGLPMESDLKEFFVTVETLKRKLLWNQYVVGFHQGYVKEYLPLTSKERLLLKKVFGKGLENVVPLDEWI